MDYSETFLYQHALEGGEWLCQSENHLITMPTRNGMNLQTGNKWLVNSEIELFAKYSPVGNVPELSSWELFQDFVQKSVWSFIVHTTGCGRKSRGIPGDFRTLKFNYVDREQSSKTVLCLWHRYGGKSTEKVELICFPVCGRPPELSSIGFLKFSAQHLQVPIKQSSCHGKFYSIKII